MFSCEYYETFKNACFEEHLRTAASGWSLHSLNIFTKSWMWNFRLGKIFDFLDK